jgi:5-methylcytosine-specific restriction endonuclease McrA
MCGAIEDLTADHIVPLSRGGELIVPLSQLRVLCRSCHGKITQH